MGNTVRYVAFYDSGDLSLATEHFPAHQAWYREFMARGVLLSLGPFTDRAGSMAIFATREAAEEFAVGDPFVRAGVVSKYTIREWHEATPDLPRQGPRWLVRAATGRPGLRRIQPGPR